MPSSWGRYPHATPRSVTNISWLDDVRIRQSDAPNLAFGLGRSYGDVCLNDGGNVLCMEYCNNLLAFDVQRGIVRAAAGVSIAQLLAVVVPHGWFVPVTPGTKFVTLGGALANDVHGKNHHRSGTFGCHITSFELVRSDGSRTICSQSQHSELFAATIGGLGLTGIITWVELQLIPIASRLVVEESVKVGGLAEVVRVTEESDSTWDYTVSWIDVLAKGRALGKGHVLRGRFSEISDGSLSKIASYKPMSIPFECPQWLLSRPTISAFNSIWYHRQTKSVSSRRVDFNSFFYPLDAIGKWNLLYGKRGMLQYQCVVPHEHGVDVVAEILGLLQAGKASSFLAVVKSFGSVVSPGILSFPRPGITLTLDMPNTGQRLFDALDACDKLVLASGGRVYAAKDARIRGDVFRAMYPEIERFLPYIDPAMSSSFWRRVMKGT